MDASFFKGKKVTVLGMGLHGGGVGIVKYLAKHGARVVVTDLKSREQLAPSLEKLKDIKGIEYVLGQHRVEDFTQADLVIKNPVVRWDSQHIKAALDKGVSVEMDSSLFFKLCPNLIIGVTGTKGKTTTATAIAEVLRSAGRDVVQVGIGQVSVLDKLNEIKKNTVVVFELSSWRLSALGRAKLSPQIAVLTNLFPDHLNYYKSMDEYAADKKNIFLYQKTKDWLVANGDNEMVMKMATSTKSQLLKFSKTELLSEKSIFLKDDAIYWKNGAEVKEIIELRDLKLRGRHNWENLMAAAGACLAFGLTVEEIKKGMTGFKGVSHRLEFVREWQGVKYYNDTAATIPEAAILALGSFTEPIVLIAGGSDKMLEFGEYAKIMLDKAREIILLQGKGTDNLLLELRKDPRYAERKIELAESMEQAVTLANGLAKTGDIILLSPGAASFGMFVNEFDRGDKFKKAVNELK
ncbi:UDP-N-acetylmuramoyl-L-alanine--D-glutamate ligase [Patescibacteria group bacterium]|nr:MAG: UDP-N-acetylmuramoyl-L-alanine--D-glutamate ligase [Patescibacteria group bacterium]